MYESIAEYIEDVRTSFLIDESDSIYARRMEEVRSPCKGRFDRVIHSLENLRTLDEKLHSRLGLGKDVRIASPVANVAGLSETSISGVPVYSKLFPSVEQMGEVAHMAAEPNTARRRAHEMKQTSSAGSPGAPSRGPGTTVNPDASNARGWPRLVSASPWKQPV